MSQRRRKTKAVKHFYPYLGSSDGLQYHKFGYNFSKTFLDTSQFANEPFVLYKYAFGNSTDDWCEGPKPKLFEPLKESDDPLHAVIENSSKKALPPKLETIKNQKSARTDTNKAVLSELQNVSAQIKATADTNKAIVNTIKDMAETIKHMADTMQSFKASIETPSTNYYNQPNVTVELLNKIK